MEVVRLPELEGPVRRLVKLHAKARACRQREVRPINLRLLREHFGTKDVVLCPLFKLGVVGNGGSQVQVRRRADGA